MEAIGSNYDFNSFELDARRYIALHNNHILAFQLYMVSKRGNPPFYEMAPLGGEIIMRGYYKGRYRDNNLLTGQVEYRTRFGWRRLGLVLFLGAGDVSSEYTHFKLTELKYSYGAGLRFRLDEKEKIDIRMDIGFGSNTDGVYFSIQQAF
jgi:outer membrane protein assembly factor BamA